MGVITFNCVDKEIAIVGWIPVLFYNNDVSEKTHFERIGILPQ